jgi:pimeloyl-ACP methyl ester carboxylesterase
MPFAPVKAIRLHYQRTGQGPDLVMVHGLAANLAFWYLKIIPRLAAGYRVTAYDLRGHGRSDMPPDGYDLSTMVEDLDGLMDHLRIDRAHLVGHSFGGSIVLKYALEHPERVESLILADAAVGAIQRLDDGPDWEYWAAWRDQLGAMGIDVPAQLPKVAFDLISELADPRWAEARQRNRSSGVFVPFGLWNGARRGAARWLQLLRTTTAWRDFQATGGLTLDRIRQIRRPVLLIFGERSRWLTTCRTLGKALPRSQTVVLDGVGHFHPLLRPARFVQHLRRFTTGAALP